jgi:hypothetical protein
MNETRKFPLWKNVVLLLEEQGVNCDTVIKTEWLEAELQLKYGTPQFGGSIHKIRLHFEHMGLYLTQSEQRGKQFVFLPYRDNFKKIQSFDRQAKAKLKRGLILGASTPVDGMTEEERVRHERWTEAAGVRSAFLHRSISTLKRLSESFKKPRPKLAPTQLPEIKG